MKGLEVVVSGQLFDVEFDFTRGCSAKLDAAPEDCYPAEDDEVEIIELTFSGMGDEYSLTEICSDKFTALIKEKIIEAMCDA